MDRKTLEALGLEKEAIDKVLDAWHKTLTPIKEEAEEAKKEAAELQSKLDSTNKQIEELSKSKGTIE